MPLNIQTATELAFQLSTVPSAPMSDSSYRALAIDLIEICADAAEAEAIVHAARFHWQKWQGTPGLLELLRTHRHPPALAPERQVIHLGPKPEILCRTCQDFGFRLNPDHAYEHCGCSQGRQLEQDDPTFVATLNAKHVPDILHRPPQQEAKRATAQQLERSFEERQARYRQEVASLRQVANGDNPDSIKEIARQMLIDLGEETQESTR